jgi:hypothetical protein
VVTAVLTGGDGENVILAEDARDDRVVYRSALTYTECAATEPPCPVVDGMTRRTGARDGAAKSVAGLNVEIREKSRI